MLVQRARRQMIRIQEVERHWDTSRAMGNWKEGWQFARLHLQRTWRFEGQSGQEEVVPSRLAGPATQGPDCCSSCTVPEPRNANHAAARSALPRPASAASAFGASSSSPTAAMASTQRASLPERSAWRRAASALVSGAAVEGLRASTSCRRCCQAGAGAEAGVGVAGEKAGSSGQLAWKKLLLA